MTTPLKLLVATDIFGATTALQSALAQLTTPTGLSVALCQPASCAPASAPFSDDIMAYQAFMQKGGLELYQQQVLAAVTRQQPDLLLGFSAGAAALWFTLSRLADSASPVKALLCYGGQIRQQSQLQPQRPVTCLWSDETHFDVRSLQQVLANQHNLQQQHWPYGHGFINPLSQHYQPAAAAKFWQQCQRWLVGGDF